MKRKFQALQARRLPEAGDDGRPSEQWIILVPPGDTIRGQDGREFRSPGADELLAAQQRSGLRIPVDENHSTPRAAMMGGPAPALGWIGDFRVNDGALEGLVKWNARGRAALDAGDYGYYSPGFDLSFEDEYGPPKIESVTSVGLVNVPNLVNLSALNASGVSMKKVAERLGLPQDATEEQILAKLAERDGSPPAGTNAAQVVPRADYDAVRKRAEDAEAKVAQNARESAEAEAAAVKREFEAEFEAGVRDRKISLHSRDYHKATATASRDGLNAFKALLTGTPTGTVLSSGAVAPPGRPPAGATPEEKAVFGQMGIPMEGQS